VIRAAAAAFCAGHADGIDNAQPLGFCNESQPGQDCGFLP